MMWLSLEKLTFDKSFPYKVGVHNSCHGHRVLKLQQLVS